MSLRLEAVALGTRARPRLQPITHAFAAGVVTTLFGPAGAGKSSLLRLLAGLEPPSTGRLHDGDVDVTGWPARRRNVALVHSRPVNYPTFSVFDNIAAPLRRGADGSGGNGAGSSASGDPIATAVTAIAARLGLTAKLACRPGALGDADRQRVALARALVRRPAVLLLDEPLAALAGAPRDALHDDLAGLLPACGATVVHATADPAEALALGRDTAVLDGGRLLQAGASRDVFLRPASLAVARVFGRPPLNLIGARAERNLLQIDGGPRIALHAPLAAAAVAVTVGIRPGDLRLQGQGGDVHFDARVATVAVAGSDTLLQVDSPVGPLLVQRIGIERFEIGQPLRLHFDPGAVYAFDGDGALLLAPERVQLLVPGRAVDGA
ncbi:MAG: ABC transporter ATP-binding protein [Lautropia sp.]